MPASPAWPASNRTIRPLAWCWRLPESLAVTILQRVSRYGYAGGLGPDNLRTEIPKIAEASGRHDFWIDMEGKVRDDSDRLDLSKVRRVLEICAPSFAG